MLLGLLSDSHDDAAAMRAALALLEAHRPAAYLHAGDLVSLDMLALFAAVGIAAPVHLVFGNGEYDHAAIKAQALRLGLHHHSACGELEFAGRRVALLHGHDERLMGRLMESRRFEYVVRGHTHVRADHRVGSTRQINPGALYRTRARSVALLDVAADTLRFLDLPCREPGHTQGSK